MKKFGKLVCLVLVFSMVFGVCPAFANGDRVEISFCVGDDTLMINGTAVTVERPYVVGEGVTLVPLRVITEAFGAKVDWEDATQTITLTYPDVSIVLQIGNPVAEVNGKAETLLAAPELPTEYTMVPLRFISETFGAQVSYDEATERITVVKEKAQSGTGLVGAVDSAYIGDSYYKWSMENPADMTLDEREFDGAFTGFKNENGFFYIDIITIDEEHDFEKRFVETKSSLQGYTLVKADKDVSDPKKRTMHFQAKDKESFLNIRILVTERYSFLVSGAFNIEEEENKNECVRIMDTFDLKFAGNDIYDLSNVKDGVRRFEDEKLKLSFDVPHNYYIRDTENTVNRFEFISMEPDDDVSTIAMAVYSKSEVGDAQSLAKEDYTGNKSRLNETLSSFSEGITEKKYKDFNAYEYTYTLKPLKGEEYSRDVFFEKGDYTYNMCITAKMPNSKADEFMDKILNSIETDEIDSAEVGILMRNTPEPTGKMKAKMENVSVEVPNSYKVEEGNPTVMLNPATGVIMSFGRVEYDKGFNSRDTFKLLKAVEDEYAKLDKNKIIINTVKCNAGDNEFMTMTVKTTENDTVVYSQQFIIIRNNELYRFMVTYPELSYSSGNRKETMDVVSSMKFE